MSGVFAVRVSVLGLGLLALAPAPVAAQSFGAKGGASLSQIVFADGFAATTPMAPGLVGGGYVRFGLPWGLFLQVEGLVAEYRPTVVEVQKDRLRYVELPVLLRYRLLGADGARQVHVIGGAVARRLLSADETVSGETYSIKEGVAPNDVALAIGGEVQVLPRWAVEVRYLHGREGVYRRFRGGYTGTHRAVQVTVGYALKP